jgi:hypothetical protein
MPGCTLTNFDISIQGEKAPYSITARYGSFTANGEFRPSIVDPEWHKAYHTLAQSMLTPDADAVMAVGSRLWAALIRGPVRDLWVSARADIERERVAGLRLRLDLQPPPVAALPWESLYDPDRNVVFAAHPHFALVRVATIYQHVASPRPLRVQLPLRVLIAAPDDASGVIDHQREIAEISQIMGKFSQRDVQVETLTGSFTITDLRTTLAKVKPVILHFIGHGEPSGLWLWQRGRPTLTPAQSLRAVMERSPSVRLALLNSCLAARPGGPHPFGGVAAQLLQAGVPAVIGMQYPIRNDAAIDFAHFLYEELLSGSCPGVIDYAVSAARSGLYAVNPGDFSFGTPLLWLNSEEGRIFAPSKDTGDNREGDHREAEHEDNAEPNEPILPSTQTEAPAIDISAENEWINYMVAITDLEQLSMDFYFLRNKWVNLVDELRSLLHQLSVLVKQPDGAIYMEKVAEYRRYKAALLRVKRLIEEATSST